MRTRTRELSPRRPGGSPVLATGARRPAGEGANVSPGPGPPSTPETREPTGDPPRRRVREGRGEKAPRSTHHLRRGPPPLPVPAGLPLRVFLRPHFRRSALSHCARFEAGGAPARALRRARRKRALRPQGRPPPRPASAPPPARPARFRRRRGRAHPPGPRRRVWPGCPAPPLLSSPGAGFLGLANTREARASKSLVLRGRRGARAARAPAARLCPWMLLVAGECRASAA